VVRWPVTCCLSSTPIRELELLLSDLQDSVHYKTLERIFIEYKVYKTLEGAKTEDNMRKVTWDGMHKHKKEFYREMIDEDLPRLFNLPIRRISAFDREKHLKDIEKIEKRIKSTQTQLKNMVKTTRRYIDGLIDEFADDYPRQTRFAEFIEIDKKSIARDDIRLSYDPKTSFFGKAIKGKDHALSVSEYDRVLLLSSDGTFRVVKPPEKILLPKKLMVATVFNKETGYSFLVVYRDSKKAIWAKRVHIKSFTTGRVYELAKGGGKVLHLLPFDAKGKLNIELNPAPRQKKKMVKIDLKDVAETGVSARGKKLTDKSVKKIKWIPA